MKRAGAKETPRPSISSSATRDEQSRKTRNIRDRGYLANCADEIVEFLLRNDYDKSISAETLENPSLKDFQNIFKAIYRTIDATGEFSRKFEEEVILFLKGMKYPYSSEINRSQLIAVTPHTRPIVLSMLQWVVSLSKSVEDVVCEASVRSGDSGIKELFYNYIFKEYSYYMEGRDEELEDVEEGRSRRIDREIEEINKEKIRSENEKRSALDRIKKEIEALDSSVDIEKLEEKKEQIESDLEKLASLKKNNEVRQKKYKKALEETREALEKALEESARAYKKKCELEEEMRMQVIGPEEVEEITEERDTLIKVAEEIKNSKTALVREADALKEQVKQATEEVEKLLHEISAAHVAAIAGDEAGSPSSGYRNEPAWVSGRPMRQSTGYRAGAGVSIRLIRRREGRPPLEYDTYEIEGDINEEHLKAKEMLEKIAESNTETEEKLQQEKERNFVLRETQKSLTEKIASKEERVKIHAQVYIEKKEAFEEEYRRAVGRVDKAEGELLKILADGDNGVFQSEQALERLRIKKGRLVSKAAIEEAELQRIKSLVSANIQSLHERVHEAYVLLAPQNIQ